MQERNRKNEAPEHKGSKDKPYNSKGVEVRHIVTNPANPIILSDKSVLEL